MFIFSGGTRATLKLVFLDVQAIVLLACNRDCTPEVSLLTDPAARHASAHNGHAHALGEGL